MRKAVIGLIVVLLVLVGVAASALVLIDGERLRRAAIEYIERRDGVELEIDSLERSVGLSPRIEVRGVRLRQPEFTDSALLEVDYAAFNVDLLSLLLQPVTLRDVVVESPLVVLPVADEGLLYWGPVIADVLERLQRFDWALEGFRAVGLEVEALHTARDARALLTAAAIDGTMPQVADLSLRMSQISGDAHASLPLKVDGSLAIDEIRLQHTDGDLPVTLEADGRIGSEPLSLRVRSANVLKGDPSARGALAATLELGASTLRMNGTASRGSSPHFDLEFEVADSSRSPSSEVRFRLSDEGLAWNIRDLSAVVGDATASGHLRVERRDARPLVTGALELAGFAVGSSGGASSKLFRLAVERLDRLDAKVDVQASAVKLFGVPVARLSGEVQLADGRLQLAPVDAEVLGGAAGASLSLIRQDDLPWFELTTSFGGVETSELADLLGVEHDVFGELQGSFELTSAAPENITRTAAGSATLLMSGGRLSAALAELVDMDFAERIMSAFKKKNETTPIRCAIADFEGRDGIFESQALVVDTGEVKLVGAGTINLAERTLDLVIRPYGKDFSLLSSDAPLRVTGSLSRPDVTPQKGALAASLLTPIEIGRADHADCQALVEMANDAMNDSARRTTARRNGQ